MWRLSNMIHNRIWTDTDESLCSRAWRMREYSLFWRCWVVVFGKRHCKSSYQYWHGYDGEN